MSILLELIAKTREATERLQAMNEALPVKGISAMQLRVMISISKNGPSVINRMAERFSSSRSTVKKAVESLEADGLVHGRPVCLTAGGRCKVAGIDINQQLKAMADIRTEDLKLKAYRAQLGYCASTAGLERADDLLLLEALIAGPKAYQEFWQLGEVAGVAHDTCRNSCALWNGQKLATRNGDQIAITQAGIDKLTSADDALNQL